MESVDIICSEFLNKEKQPSKLSNGAALQSQIGATGSVETQKTQWHGYNMNLSIGDSLRNFFNNKHTQTTQKPLLVTDQHNNNNTTTTSAATPTCCHSNNNNNNGVIRNLNADRLK